MRDKPTIVTLICDKRRDIEEIQKDIDLLVEEARDHTCNEDCYCCGWYQESIDSYYSK